VGEGPLDERIGARHGVAILGWDRRRVNELAGTAGLSRFQRTRPG
jgi:hypothetical protein